MESARTAGESFSESIFQDSEHPLNCLEKMRWVQMCAQTQPNFCQDFLTGALQPLIRRKVNLGRLPKIPPQDFREKLFVLNAVLFFMSFEDLCETLSCSIRPDDEWTIERIAEPLKRAWPNSFEFLVHTAAENLLPKRSKNTYR